MSDEQPLLRTTVVGSYPQPDWLIDKEILRGRRVPRVRAEELWRIPAELRAEALRDATLLAIRDMEAAGVDVITDGEIARESYSNHFSSSLSGLDEANPAIIRNRLGRETRVPRIVGPIRHQRPVEAAAARFLRAHTGRLAKITLPGPFTLGQQVKDEHYGDPEAVALDFAAAVNAEARALEETGIDVIQIDEPWLRNDPQAARRYGVRVIARALAGLRVRTAVHICFGYAFLAGRSKPRAYEFLAEIADAPIQEISIEAAQPDLDLQVLSSLPRICIALGVLDHSRSAAEPAEVVAQRIRAALRFVPPDRLMPAPDCGMKYMARDEAFARLSALSAAAKRVRREITGNDASTESRPW
jgi:5-methyltetrahydropteroyltriglutamate--homocysteine methyltransferase